MPTYKYIAVNLQKQKFKGKFIADDEKDLAVQLAKQNLYLVSATLYKDGTPSSLLNLGSGKVALGELTSFCRQFSIMLTSGIHLVNCLEMLKSQPYSSYFKSILQMVCDDVKAGEMLSAALDKHKKVFPNFFLSMVHVGEASGNLDAVFIALADYYESDAAIKRKAKSALAYPMMLGIMTLAIVVLMLTFVVPTFKDVLVKLEIQPEGYTKIVYDVSDYLVANWKGMLVAVIAVVVAIFAFSKTSIGGQVIDYLKVKVPIINKVTIDLITARFARAFSILLASGLDLASALDTTMLILGNHYMSARFKEASEDVRQGVSLTNAFQKHNLFPEMLLQMLSVGEKTNSLDEVLGRSCKFFDEQVETSLNSLTSKIQPAMLLLMGGVIGSLFLAVYSPMLSIMNGLG